MPHVYFINDILVPYRAVFYTYQVHFEPHQFEVWRLVEVNKATVLLTPGCCCPLKMAVIVRVVLHIIHSQTHLGLETDYRVIQLYTALFVYKMCVISGPSLWVLNYSTSLWQKQGSWAGTSNYILQDAVSGTEILIWSPKAGYLIKYVYNILEVMSQWNLSVIQNSISD